VTIALVSALLVAAIAICVVLIPASRGGSRAADTLEPALDQLLNLDDATSFLVIKPRFAPHIFLQYAMYPESRTAKGFGVQIVFPQAEWSKEFFPKVVTKASKEGIRYEIIDDDGGGLRFAMVRFGKDVRSAAEFGRSILIDIFGFDSNYRFRARIN
jgi:hypothetical protein